jgi:hypothetical protein
MLFLGHTMIHGIRKDKTGVNMPSTTTKQKTLPQEQVLGQLLVDVVNGMIQESTRKNVCALEYNHVPSPFNHLVSWIQGSSESNRDLTVSVLKDVKYILRQVEERIT